MRVERCFAFVDLSGFTRFTDRHGDEYTVVILANFRTALREIAARRGVRITKWLGDGAMVSSADSDAIVALVLELAARTDPEAVPLPIRAGLAQGPVIMFEGDDYIGRTTNVAARLCDLALPAQILCTREVASFLPPWAEASDPEPRHLPGLDRPVDTCALSIRVEPRTVIDAYCGLVLPDIPGLPTRFGEDGSVNRFCGAACALSWEQRRQMPSRM